MDVFDKAKVVSGLGKQQRRPYLCLSCRTAFEIQYHSCPACGGYDIRRAKWVE
jgi:rRNA maturation endonuclease Nob1